MSQQIDTALVNQFKAGFDLQFQQMGSRLKPAVRNESQNGEYAFYDRIGPTAVTETVTRHADTVLIDTPHSRRRVGLRDFHWADLIDDEDKIRTLGDPASPYAQNAAMAMGRKVDEVIIAAITGTAYTGKGGGTPITSGWNTVGLGTVLNIATLLAVRQELDADEAVDPGEDLFFLTNANGINGLLNDTNLTSADYNSVKALVRGELDTFCGFRFIRTELVTGTTTSYAFARNGLLLATGMDVSVSMDRRPDKRNSLQVLLKASFNATRMWEEKIVVITHLA